MKWKCRHCGHQSESETSCCWEHWQEASAIKTSSFWFLGSAFMVAAGLVALISWLITWLQS